MQGWTWAFRLFAERHFVQSSQRLAPDGLVVAYVRTRVYEFAVKGSMAYATAPHAGFGAVISAQDEQQQQLMVSQLEEFTFQVELRRRLQACLCSLAQQIPLHNIGCVQVGNIHLQ